MQEAAGQRSSPGCISARNSKLHFFSRGAALQFVYLTLCGVATGQISVRATRTPPLLLQPTPSTHDYKSQSKYTPQQIHVISPFAPERLIRNVRFLIVTSMLTLMTKQCAISVQWTDVLLLPNSI